MQEIIITKENSFSDRLILNESHFGVYYSYEDVLNAYPDFNKAHFGRKVLKKYNFNNDDYSYILYSSKIEKYKIYDESYCKAKIFFKKQWVDQNMVNRKKDYIDLPPPLKINDIPDFFKNGDFSLKFRGEKTRDKLLISMKSIVKVLELNYTNLKNNLITGKYKLKKNEHYVMCGVKDKDNKFYKIPYFTYIGFAAYIFITKSKNAHLFINYFETIVFASLFGSVDQKVEMVITHTVQKLIEIIEKMGSPVIDVLKTLSVFGKVSCLYLLILEEQNDGYIVKFGMTENLKCRLNEHLKVFGNVYVKICQHIELFSPYDLDKTLFAAEKELYEFFGANHIQIKKWSETVDVSYREIFKIKKSDLKVIKKKYCELGLKYNKKGDGCELFEKDDCELFYKSKIKDIKSDFKLKILEKEKEIENTFAKLDIIENNYKKIIENMKIEFNQKEDSFKRKIDNLYLKLEITELKLSIYLK